MCYSFTLVTPLGQSSSLFLLPALEGRAAGGGGQQSPVLSPAAILTHLAAPGLQPPWGTHCAGDLCCDRKVREKQRGDDSGVSFEKMS